MRSKIIGVTVGTSMSPAEIGNDIKPDIKAYVDAENEVLRVEIEALKALVDKLDKQLNPKMEVWRIRDDANTWDMGWTKWNVNFVANGIKFAGMQLGGDGDPYLSYIYTDGTELYLGGISSPDVANVSDYLTIKFVRDEISNESFVAWLEANATLVKIGDDFVGEMITFTIEGIECSCPKGMTWADYIGSEYQSERFIMSYPYLEDKDISIELVDEYNGTLVDEDAYMTQAYSSVIIEGYRYVIMT